MSFDRDRLPDPTAYFENAGLVLKGPSSAKWKTTRCEFHNGSDSMRVNTESGAWVCMACGAKGGDVLAYEMQSTGTEFVQAAKALGAWADDGRPPTQTKPTALSARAALGALAFETLVVAVAAGNVSQGLPLTEHDLQRVMVAAGRIQHIAGDFA
jgi:hypothetical protein